jgi:hypothetical protein
MVLGRTKDPGTRLIEVDGARLEMGLGHGFIWVWGLRWDRDRTREN